MAGVMQGPYNVAAWTDLNKLKKDIRDIHGIRDSFGDIEYVTINEYVDTFGPNPKSCLRNTHVAGVILRS